MSAAPDTADPAGSRELKRRLARLLEGPDFAAALAEIDAFSPRRAVSPLFSLFCDRRPLVRFRAAEAAGRLTAREAEREIESARVVMRRFMWNLNEESGGIGWGCPEAMAEAMALSPQLAEEYGRVYTAYLRPGGCFLEYPPIQRGVLWGFGRLGRAYPGRLAACAALVLPFLSAGESALRGTAAWAAGGMGAPELARPLAGLSSDTETFELYRNGAIERLSVGAAAAESLRRIEGAGGGAER